MLAELVSNTDPAKFRIFILCINSLGPIAKELMERDIYVSRVARMTRGSSFFYPRPLINALKKLQPDIVHIHSGCWLKSAIAARLAGVKHIFYTEHGRTFPEKKMGLLLDIIASKLTDQVITVSKNLEDYMARYVLSKNIKLSTISNGIDVGRFYLYRNLNKDRHLVIGIVARLSPVKNIETLLHAIKIVIAHCPDIVVNIVGDGPEKENLITLSAQLQIQDKVNFLGFRRDIPEIVSQFDIFVLCSLSEGTSITLLEAMAAGKPIVATNVGGTPVLVKDGEGGFLFVPGDVAMFAGHIMKLVTDHQLRVKMGEYNISRVAQYFSVKAMVHEYERLYLEQVIGQNTRVAS